MAAGDFYNVVLSGLTSGQQLVSDFWYRQESGDGDSDDLALRFIAAFMPVLTNIISVSTQFTHLKVVNHYNAVDFYDQDFTPVIPGLQAGARAPVFLAAAFKQPRKIAKRNNGAKRFGTLSEADTNGDIITAGSLARFTAVAAALSADLVVTDTPVDQVFEPVIVLREKYTTPGGKQAYRVPALITPGMYYTADAWQVVNNLTTQNSRKLGVGA